jgi:hypothetical protein
MSLNFTGVTFAEQKVTPSDDAIIRRAILPDGILTGCAISYSGSTLTMAAGQLMICGRQIRHPSAQNWAIVDANSGYARLVLTIDLTRTATKDTFDQVIDSIEYATAADGFPELEQADINSTGVRYQVAACVVSLGTGGITGIVSQLQKSRADSGGGLNFKLVGGTTQPADPSENMIWVNTDTKVSGFAFDSAAPASPEIGTVWIQTGTSSRTAFNALKANSIMLYPLKAKQYINGAWNDRVAQSYMDGEWVDWYAGQLYENGEEYADITGGFSLGTQIYSKAEKNADYILLSASESTNSAYSHATCYTNDVIDLTGHNTLKAVVYTEKYGNLRGFVKLGITDSQVNFAEPTEYREDYINGVESEKTGDVTLTYDISSVSGSYYVGIINRANATKVYAIILE